MLNMRITFIIVLLFLFFYAVSDLQAQEDTAPSEVSDEATSEVVEDDSNEDEEIIQKRITDLKERLATRVAELQLINKRSFYGVLNEKTDTKFDLAHKELDQLVATDTETTFFSQDINGKRTSTDLASIEPGQSLVVFGTLDIDGKTLIAQEAIAQVMPTTYFGPVTNVDSNEGTFTVSNGETVIFDYEIGTKCVLYVDEGEIDTCGLSKIKEQSLVIVRGEPDATNLTSAKALRVLVLPSTAAKEPTPTETVRDTSKEEELPSEVTP